VTIPETLIEWAHQRGYKAGFAGVSLLEIVREKLAKRKEKGEFAPGFFEENLGVFTYLDGVSMRRPESVVIVAVPSPSFILKFELEAGPVETILPPTYVRYRALFESVRQDLEKTVFGRDGSVETVQAPLKSLAVCLGMASYGRNNITYVPEFGSYFQLAGYVTDVPLGTTADDIQLERKLELCSSCRVCLKACPTGAIAGDRFLIHAERCYTLRSESSKPIPPDVEPPSHECLIGCLKCQELCPANKGRLKKEKADVSFTKEETLVLLEEGDCQDEDLAKSIQAKFVALALSESPSIFRRNLRLLLKLKSTGLNLLSCGQGA
jgi:epoxyqueuosine reductase